MSFYYLSTIKKSKQTTAPPGFQSTFGISAIVIKAKLLRMDYFILRIFLTSLLPHLCEPAADHITLYQSSNIKEFFSLRMQLTYLENIV